MKNGLLIAVVYITAMLTGCATAPATSNDAAARAVERMDLIIAGEIIKAYEYLSPGYRSSVSMESYLGDMITRKVRWRSSELLGSECTENRCAVRFKVDFVVPSPVPGVRQFDFFDNLEQDWIFTQGQWWFVPEN